jgi:hypothetical protein
MVITAEKTGAFEYGITTDAGVEILYSAMTHRGLDLASK